MVADSINELGDTTLIGNRAVFGVSFNLLQRTNCLKDGLGAPRSGWLVASNEAGASR